MDNMLYVAIFAHFLGGLFVLALQISFPVYTILNKVKKVNISCVLFYSESPLSCMTQRSTTVVYNEFSVSVWG